MQTPLPPLLHFIAAFITMVPSPWQLQHVRLQDSSEKWGEGQGIITVPAGLKIAWDLIPGMIYSSEPSWVGGGGV